MDKFSEKTILEGIIRTLNDNSTAYSAGDTFRAAHTDGVLSGLCTALKLSGHQVSYDSWTAENGCLKAENLTIDNATIFKEGAIQPEPCGRLKRAMMPQTEFSIYQINPDRDSHDLLFINREHMELLTGNSEIDSSIYDRVYSGHAGVNNLEDLFQMFNTEPPEDFFGHSLSVSDVVEIVSSPVISSGSYFCDSLRFDRIKFDPSLTSNSKFLNTDIPHSRQFLTLDAWKDGPPPQNAEDIIIAFNQQVHNYLESNPRAADNDIQLYVDKLWDLYCLNDEIGGVKSIWPEDNFSATKAKVLLVEPGQVPRTIEMGTDLNSLQKAVYGYIEAVYPFDDPIALIVNEEGKNRGLTPNRALRDKDNNIYDIIHGPMLVVGLDDENFCGLTPPQIATYSKVFHTPELFISTWKGDIIALPMKEKSTSATREDCPKKDSKKHSGPER